MALRFRIRDNTPGCTAEAIALGMQRSTFLTGRQGGVRQARYGVSAKGHAEHVPELIKGI